MIHQVFHTGHSDPESHHLDASFCFACRNSGWTWTDSTGEPRSCPETHPHAERCHCGIAPVRCVGCRARLYVVAAEAEEGAYCIACAAELVVAVKCEVFETSGEPLAESEAE